MDGKARIAILVLAAFVCVVVIPVEIHQRGNLEAEIGNLKAAYRTASQRLDRLEGAADKPAAATPASMPDNYVDLDTFPGGSWIFVPQNRKPRDPVPVYDRPGVFAEHKLARSDE